MFKTIIKEFIIFLLLLVSIALLLGVLFYDYIPNARTIPSKVAAYTFPSDVEAELRSAITEQGEESIKTTYTIDSTDLRGYEDTNKYDKGKINPFEKYTEPVATPSGDEGNTNNNNNNSSSNNTTGNSVGNFYEDDTNTKTNK